MPPSSLPVWRCILGLASEPIFKTGFEFGEEFLDGGLLEREDGEDIVGVP